MLPLTFEQIQDQERDQWLARAKAELNPPAERRPEYMKIAEIEALHKTRIWLYQIDAVAPYTVAVHLDFVLLRLDRALTIALGQRPDVILSPLPDTSAAKRCGLLPDRTVESLRRAHAVLKVWADEAPWEIAVQLGESLRWLASAVRVAADQNEVALSLVAGTTASRRM